MTIIITIIIITIIIHQELSRCQGWPDDTDWNGLSKTQLGDALGNSWPLNVSVRLIRGLAKCLKWEAAYL